MAKNSKFLIIGLSAAVLILLAGGFVLTRYLNYRKTSLAGMPNRPQPSIVITTPQNYGQESVRFPIPVAVSAHSYRPIKSLQLWVNGVQMGEEDIFPQNTLSFDTGFVWLPGGAGKYSLVARVIDQAGDTADSPLILVNVLAYTPPAGGTNTTAFDTGQALVMPAAPSGGGPVPPPAPGQSSGPGKSGGPSFGDFLNDLTVKTPPTAPGLVASVQGCSVNLQLHDLSNNEDGFQIYRSTNGTPSWAKIASLNSQSTLDWLTYTDTLTGGTQASYYALAVNAAGQSESNLVSVDVDTTGCPAAPGGQKVLELTLKSFDTGGAADQSYCYRSLDDIHWERWPSTGFLPSGKSPLDPSKTGMAFDLTGVAGRPGLTKFDLTLECWGWSGGVLKFLGKVHFSNPDLSNIGPLTASDGSLNISFNLGDGGKVPFGYTLPPQDKNMPFIDAWLTYDPNVCKNHLAPSAQNDLGAFLFCSPYPGYSIGAKTANPQPYLVWFVLENTCPAGFGNSCATIADLENDAKKTGAQLYYLLHQEDKLTGDYYGLPIGQTAYVYPMANCPGDFTATIQLDYVAPGDWATSVESNPVTIPCTQPLGDSVPINVTFQSITLSNVQDGDSGVQTVELYGDLIAQTTSGFTQHLSLGNSDSSFRDANGCPNEDVFNSFHTNGLGGLGCLGSYTNGTTSLGSVEMCLTDIPWSCWLTSSNTETPFAMNNNTIKVPVSDGDAIQVSADVWDYDSASADDLVCSSQGATVARSFFAWSNLTTTDTVLLKSNDFGSGACTITVKIKVAH
ncbi:MAG TPA: hypothetical protein VMC09_18200 [Anaerolineales bacterium]|nr:hypothetical protein [Anaerolineales bacterium]